MDLFSSSQSPAGLRGVPLAARMRPVGVDDVVGQKHLLAAASPLRAVLSSDRSSTSVILWGPPGTGKTTLARVIANSAGARFEELTAVSATVKDVRAVLSGAQLRKQTDGSATVLFVDEVHRFSKTQQDALLPAVENGLITLLGATTENPSFSVIPALLSRSLVLPLHSLEAADVSVLVNRAIQHEMGLAGSIGIADDARNHLIRLSGGDARRALTLLEAAASAVLAREALNAVPHSVELTSADVGPFDGSAERPSSGGPSGDEASDGSAGDAGSAEEVRSLGRDGDTGSDSGHGGAGHGEPEPEPIPNPRGGSREPIIVLADIESATMHAAPRYDRAGDRHYDVASALIKSMRGSDVDAALHYLAVMIEAGEDPRFIARRLVILASEDIGMADPSALTVATAAHTAVSSIGMPEARIILAQATIHLALAPKSNASYRAIDSALADVRSGATGPVPDHLRDASTKSARADGAGRGYIYPHDDPIGVAVQQYAPDAIAGTVYYEPTMRGGEARASESVQRLRALLPGQHPGKQEG
jgi:putative ATPase